MKIFSPIISGSITTTVDTIIPSASYSLTSSLALNSELLDNLDSSAFAKLSVQNTFSNDQTINGSLNVVSGITGSLLGTASYSVISLSSSYSNQALSSSYASNSDLLDGLNASNFANLNSVNTFNGNQVINGNVTIHGTASVEVLITTYESSSVIFTSGSTKFGNSYDDTHNFTGSASFTNGLTGSLLGTASNAIALNGLDSSAYSKSTSISLTLNGVVSGSNPTLIGTFYLPLNSVYSTSSFFYFGGSQGSEEATIEIRNYSSPTSIHSLNKSTTLSISYLTSSLSLTAGLYNLYLYSSGSGSAIAKSLYLTS